VDERELKKLELELLAKQAEFQEEKLKFQRSKRFSIAAIASLLALVISGLQVWVSIEQRKLSQAQTVQQYIPHLIREDTRDLAIKSLTNYFDDEYIIDVAESYKSTVTLNQLAKSQDAKTQEQARLALAEIATTRAQLIQNIFSDDRAARIQSANEIVTNWKSDPLLVSDLIDYAKLNFDNVNGVYNAAVVLNSLNVSTLRANAGIVEEFIDLVNDTNRNKTKALLRDIFRENQF
jgi:hypothetical protein